LLDARCDRSAIGLRLPTWSRSPLLCDARCPTRRSRSARPQLDDGHVQLQHQWCAEPRSRVRSCLGPHRSQCLHFPVLTLPTAGDAQVAGTWASAAALGSAFCAAASCRSSCAAPGCRTAALGSSCRVAARHRSRRAAVLAGSSSCAAAGCCACCAAALGRRAAALGGSSCAAARADAVVVGVDGRGSGGTLLLSSRSRELGY